MSDLAFNSGFSFGTGAGQGPIIALLVLVVVAWLVRYLSRQTSTVRIVLLSIIIGGALGNLADRTFRADDGFLSGEVIDFIDVSWYAVFNVADLFVVGGALVLVGYEFFVNREVEASS